VLTVPSSVRGEFASMVTAFAINWRSFTPDDRPLRSVMGVRCQPDGVQRSSLSNLQRRQPPLPLGPAPPMPPATVGQPWLIRMPHKRHTLTRILRSSSKVRCQR
jgi:hypothetical protein